MSAILIGFIVYLLVVLLVGFLTLSKNKDLCDFVLGGRKLGAWVITFSERASGESAWLLIGLPGAALVAGVLELWTVIGCVSGIIFSWFAVSYKLRVESEKYDALTLPEYFVNRFGDDNNLLRIVSASIITFFFVFYVAAQFSGAGKVLNVSFGISQVTGMFIGAGIILIYTIMGGFLAVAWTDLVQGIIMICTLVILPILGIYEIGGFAELSARLSGVDANLTHFAGGKNGIEAFAIVIGGLSWGLGYMGQPHLLSRYMSINDPANLKKGRLIATAWAIPAFLGAFTIGLVGLALYSNVFTGPGAMDSEKLMPYVATNLLPAWLAGIFISGAIAAMMSTADSQLLVSTSILTEDIYNKLLRKESDHRKLLTVCRIITIIIGIIAFIMAVTSKDLVFELVSFAWSGLGASFGVPLFLTLYWKRITRSGVIAGMLTGSITTIVWAKTPFLKAMMTERLVSFVLALAITIIFSLLSSKNDNDKKDK